VESFSATFLVGGGGNQLIYGSCSHLLKTSTRRRKEVHTRALARLAGRGVAWRRARAHDTCVNGPPNPAARLAGARSPFAVLVFGLLVC
jgi:hypothetical protein